MLIKKFEYKILPINIEIGEKNTFEINQEILSVLNTEGANGWELIENKFIPYPEKNWKHYQATFKRESI